MRRTYAIVALGLAGFFGVTACSATSQSPPPPAQQAASQSAPQAASPSAAQVTSPSAAQVTSPSAAQVTSPSAAQVTSPSAAQVSSVLPGAGTVKAVTDETFEGEVLESGKPVVVEYWAEWCGPCRKNAPILAEIAAEHADKITVAKLNIDENPAVPALYGIETIPTIDVFSNGQRVKQIVGAKPKSALLSELAGFI